MMDGSSAVSVSADARVGGKRECGVSFVVYKVAHVNRFSC